MSMKILINEFYVINFFVYYMLIHQKLKIVSLISEYATRCQIELQLDVCRDPA